MNRRSLLQQGALALAGLSILPLSGFATAVDPSPFIDDKPNGEPINLSSNENPYGPSPAARKAMMDAVRMGNRYQWAMIRELMAAIAVKNAVTADNVIMGAGSTEILDLMVQYAAQQKGSVLLADNTFGRWSHTAEQQGMQKIEVPLTTDKKHDLPAMLSAIRPDTRMVYICNPNNPTGTILDHDALVAFVTEATKKTMVMVDEAYIEFTKETSLSALAAKNKNLVVVRTFSKIYGLAGSRAGYAIAHADTIDRLGQIKCGANMGIGAVTMAGALASLNDAAFVSTTYSLNEKARTYTMTQLEQMGIRCIPSNTNFIYFSLANYPKDLFAILKQNNIMGTAILEDNGKWSRITVGTMAEMQRFVAVIG